MRPGASWSRPSARTGALPSLGHERYKNERIRQDRDREERRSAAVADDHPTCAHHWGNRSRPTQPGRDRFGRFELGRACRSRGALGRCRDLLSRVVRPLLRRAERTPRSLGRARRKEAQRAERGPASQGRKSHDSGGSSRRGRTAGSAGAHAPRSARQPAADRARRGHRPLRILSSHSC